MKVDQDHSVIYVSFIGGGEEVLPLIRSLSHLKKIKLLCVADQNEDAPALALAKELGISTEWNVHELEKQNGFNLVVIPSCTAFSEKILNEIKSNKIQIIQGLQAQLLMELASDWERLQKIEASYKISRKYLSLLEESNQKLDEKISELSIFNEMAKIFSQAAFDEKNISGFIYKLLKKKIPLNIYALFLSDEGESCLVLASDEAVPPGLKEEIRLRMCYHFANFSGKSLRSQKEMMVEILEKTEINSDRKPTQSGIPSIKEFFSYPLMILEKTIGLMGLIFFEPYSLNPDDQSFLNIIATQVALFVENDRTRQAIANERNKLEAANKELEAFSYSVSHDLRTPLRHIEGFVELLTQKSNIELDREGKHYFDIILSSTKQMGNLIDDLLGFSRMSRAEMIMTEFNLEITLKEVLQELTPELEGRSVEWEIGPLPEIEGDPSLIKIVFVNLISNALKFTNKRKSTRIEIGWDDKNPEEIVIYVRDNGVGFDMQYAHKLFGVFQRLHREDEFEGTGIGLANVQRIIHRHGGRVWAEAALDQGATFYFSLPRKRREVKKAA